MGQEESTTDEDKHETSEEDKLQTVLKRVQDAEIIVSNNVIRHDVTYDRHDLAAFPEGDIVEEAPERDSSIKIPKIQPVNRNVYTPLVKPASKIDEKKKPFYLMISIAVTVVVLVVIVCIIIIVKS